MSLPGSKLHDSGASYVSIVAVMGTCLGRTCQDAQAELGVKQAALGTQCASHAHVSRYRTGKSFLLDLLARYLKKQAAKEAAKAISLAVDAAQDAHMACLHQPTQQILAGKGIGEGET